MSTTNRTGFPCCGEYFAYKAGAEREVDLCYICQEAEIHEPSQAGRYSFTGKPICWKCSEEMDAAKEKRLADFWTFEPDSRSAQLLRQPRTNPHDA